MGSLGKDQQSPMDAELLGRIHLRPLLSELRLLEPGQQSSGLSGQTVSLSAHEGQRLS